MKTPKRTSVIVPLNPEDWSFDPPHHAGDMLARWKRKNRVKQLKRSLHRYKNGTMLDDQYDLYLAYRWLQRLKKPNKDADSLSWENYIYKLRAIRGVIIATIQEAEKAFKKALEREYRKEQG